MSKPKNRRPFTEAKSRTTVPLTTAHDVQAFDGILILDGETVTRKITTEIDLEANTVTATDPDGSNPVTIKLNPESPAKTASGEFKYWLDESKGKQNMSRRSRVNEDETDLDAESDFDFDQPTDDPLADDPVGESDDDDSDDEDEDNVDECDDDEDGDDMDEEEEFDAELAVDAEDDDNVAEDDENPFAGDDDSDDEGDDAEDEKNESSRLDADIRRFLKEEGDAPSNDETTGGAVDTSKEDEGVDDEEDSAEPHETTGIENTDQIDDMTQPGSNGDGAAPEDEVETNGEEGPTGTDDGGLLPGGLKTVDEAVKRDVSTALSLLNRAGTGKVKGLAKQLAPRVLSGG